MQASLALAARFGTCVAGTIPLRRACRHPGALTPGRRPATRRAAFASTADDAVGGGTGQGVVPYLPLNELRRNTEGSN